MAEPPVLVGELQVRYRGILGEAQLCQDRQQTKLTKRLKFSLSGIGNNIPLSSAAS